MKHRTLCAPTGALIAALLASSVANAIEREPGSVDAWATVSDDTLAALRGGLDLGVLIASFAIERLVRIDGEIVTRTQLIVSGLDRLAKGGLPDIRLIGNLANLVQIGSDNLAIGSAGPDAGAPAVAPAAGTSGSVSSTGIASGSLAQFGVALAQGVAAANGENTPSSPPAPSSAGAAATQAPSPAGPVPVVVSAIPGAVALATSIQNSVQATLIETQTSIDATLNSLAALRSASFSASLRQQAIDSVRR